MRFSRLLIFVFLLILIFACASQAARFLVIDKPEKSDIIVVLAGETNVRAQRALELMRRGVAPRAVMNAETRELIYDQKLIDILQRYIQSLPEADHISVCPITGYSTDEEVEDVTRCIRPFDPHRVLIVTSEFHTRRALTIFRNRRPQYHFSVAAAYNPSEFGYDWWKNREWAKTVLHECVKLAWWECVDRWKSHA